MGIFDTADPVAASTSALFAAPISIPKIPPKDHADDSGTSADVTVSATVALLGTLGAVSTVEVGEKARVMGKIRPYHFRKNTPPSGI